MVSRIDVLQKLYLYLRGDMDLRSLRDWVVQIQLGNENDLDDYAKRLLSEIEGRYAELSDGLILESSWRRHLQELFQPEQPRTESIVSSIVAVVPSQPDVSWNAIPSSNSTPSLQQQFPQRVGV